MKWSALDFDWNQVRAFVATAREGSFSAASRALGLTQPTLSRQVSGLEARLGVTLFERGKRSMTLTQAGAAMLEPAEMMLDGAFALSLAADGQASNLHGVVTITATSLIAMQYLPPVVARLQRMAPDLQLDVIASNSVQDLKRREADIAIRHVRPEQDDLIGKLVCEHAAGLFASPDYLDRVGRPKTIAELEGHDFIGFDEAARSFEYYKELGITVAPDRMQVRSGYGEVLVAMTREGLGICILPCGTYCEGLERVLPQDVNIKFPVWLVTHRELQTNPRIRLVFDHLTSALKHEVDETTVSHSSPKV
ncbi:LysR family transcriptional regulator [Oceanicaulis sp.]|uniref:LysR family transcriptional regulator n=1 Tax=Oceanicaulis sp. TaxID=1924941 RepID=UPI003BAB1721